MTSALYLFCLARKGLVPRLESKGINGDETLLMKDIADVTAIVCETPGEEYSGLEAERRLQDLEWVAPKAVRHERVIEEVMGYSPVLPAPFGSLFSSGESLVRLVEANLATISEFLDHVSDKVEWSVKSYLSKAKALEVIISGKSSAVSETLSSLTPGMRYFKERQIRAEADKELAGLVRTSCSLASEALIGCSVDFRQRKIVRLSKEEDGMQLIANWAFLIDSSATGEFLTRVEKANIRLNPGGLFYECSGPWPPYSFCPSLVKEPDP